MRSLFFCNFPCRKHDIIHGDNQVQRIGSADRCIGEPGQVGVVLTVNVDVSALQQFPNGCLFDKKSRKPLENTSQKHRKPGHKKQTSRNAELTWLTYRDNHGP